MLILVGRFAMVATIVGHVVALVAVRSSGGVVGLPGGSILFVSWGGPAGAPGAPNRGPVTSKRLFPAISHLVGKTG